MQLSNQYAQVVTPLLESTFKQVASKKILPSIGTAVDFRFFRPAFSRSSERRTKRGSLLRYWTLCKPIEGCDSLYTMVGANPYCGGSGSKPKVSVSILLPV
jgi:hypothetical protein